MRKLLVMLGLVGLLHGCISTSELYGNGSLVDTHQLRQAYIEHLAYTTYTGKLNGWRYTSFAVNPNTGKTGSGKDYAPSTSAARALERCGDGCFLFAELGEIVWDGFESSAEYVKFREIIHDYENIEPTYYTKGSFDLGELQLAELEENFFPEVDLSKSFRRIIAVSPNGKNFGKTFHIDEFGEWRLRRAIKIAIAACNAASGRGDCVIYAQDHKVYQ
ncbi:hypothetical protein [Curvivirga sp.]|uniref:hypothetical protein n=1 Tax=Curvivirga sp. TaxID=2856848 RepID=UPI003B5C454B